MRQISARQRPWFVSVLALCWALQVGVASASESALMEVVPDFSIVSGSSGNQGGPFTPSSVTYTVTNRGTVETLSWCAAKSQPWITLSTECGLLPPGGSAEISASIDHAVAGTLPADGYSDPIVFTNLTKQVTAIAIAISSQPEGPPAAKAAAAKPRPEGRAQRSTESGSRRSSARSARSLRKE